LRYVFTLNMPSFKNNLVQQIIGDYPVDTVEAMCDALNEDSFIVVRQFYHIIHRNGEHDWKYKGPMIINTQHIGKVQEFIDKEDEVY